MKHVNLDQLEQTLLIEKEERDSIQDVILKMSGESDDDDGYESHSEDPF